MEVGIIDYKSAELRIRNVSALDVARSIGLLNNFPVDSTLYEFGHVWSVENGKTYTDKNYSSISVWHTESINEYNAAKGFECPGFIIELTPDIVVNRTNADFYSVKFGDRVDKRLVEMVDEEIIRVHKTGFV